MVGCNNDMLQHELNFPDIRFFWRLGPKGDRFEYLGAIKLSRMRIYIQIEPDFCYPINYSDVIRVFTWTIVRLFWRISQSVGVRD